MKFRKEIVVSTVVVLAFLFFLSQTTPIDEPTEIAHSLELDNSLPATAFAPLPPEPIIVEPTSEDSESSEVRGGGGGAGAYYIPEDRIKDIRQTITGTLDKGNFEATLVTLQDTIIEFGGYEKKLEYQYEMGAWSGKITAHIPQEKSMQFVFRVREILDNAGEVISISTSIEDITEQIEPEQEIPPAAIRIVLQELQISEPVEEEIPVISQASSVLFFVFTELATYTIIGAPLFAVVLVTIVIGNRYGVPLVKKVIEKSKGEDE